MESVLFKTYPVVFSTGTLFHWPLNEQSVYVLTVSLTPQVSRRLGNMLYMMNLPLSTTSLQATPEKPGERSPEIGSPVNCNSEDMMASPRDPDVLKSTEHLHETENISPPSASSEMAWSALTTWTDANLSRPNLQPVHYPTTCCHSAGFVYMMNYWI